MKQKHTPTTWKIDKYGGIKDLDHNRVYACGFVNPMYNSVMTDEAKANDAFIVRAVNSHDALINALKGAIGALEFSRDYHSDLGNFYQAYAQDKLDEAINALALAER